MATIIFIAHGYLCNIKVDTGPHAHLNGLKAFNAIAKTVAAKL